MKFIVHWSGGDEGGYSETVQPVECESHERLVQYIEESIKMAVRNSHSMFMMFGDSVMLNDFYSSFTGTINMPYIYTLDEWFNGNVERIK